MLATAPTCPPRRRRHEQPLVRVRPRHEQPPPVRRERHLPEAPRPAEQLAPAAAACRVHEQDVTAVRCAQHDGDPAPARRPGDVGDAELGPAREHEAGGAEQLPAAGGRDQQAPAVGRPRELDRPADLRRAPEQAPGVDVDDAHVVAPVDIGEHVRAVRPPGGRHRGGRPVAVVAGAVARDHAQRAAGDVGDAVAEPSRPARRRDPAGPRQRPADAPVRLEREQLAVAPGDHEAPVRRPRRARVVAEPPPRAVGRDDPRAARRGDQQPPAARHAHERRLRVLAPDAEHVAHPARDRVAGLA